MKRIALAVIGLSSLSLFAFAGEKTKIPNVEPAGGGPTVNISDGTVVLNGITSFGSLNPGTSRFSVDELETVVFEHRDYISEGGPVRVINAVNCTIVNPITVIAPNEAVSTVQCGACTVDFDQVVDGVTQTWNTFVSITGCTAACHYAYTDYDVHGFPNNGGSWHAGEGGFLGQFVVRNNTVLPDVHYLFGDQSGASHFTQGEFPTVRTLIEGFQTCTDLLDAPPMHNGDWTSALQFDLPTVFTYQHGRDDTTTFP